MPPSNRAIRRATTDAVKQQAERHAYAQLIRTEGWRLYMVHLLNAVWTMDRSEGNGDLSAHERSKLIGAKERLLRDITFVYKQADEVNPLEVERQALLTRLAGIPYTPLPDAHSVTQEQEEAGPPPRGRRTYAGGVE